MGKRTMTGIIRESGMERFALYFAQGREISVVLVLGGNGVCPIEVFNAMHQAGFTPVVKNFIDTYNHNLVFQSVGVWDGRTVTQLWSGEVGLQEDLIPVVRRVINNYVYNTSGSRVTHQLP